MFVLLSIHDEVDNGVDGRVCHGEPEEEEKYMLCVVVLHQVLQQQQSSNVISVSLSSDVYAYDNHDH